MVRDAIESMYHDLCTVSVKRSYTRENKSTGYREEVILTNQPCKLSFFRTIENQRPTTEGTAAHGVSQQIKLFLPPELDIPAGSKITVTHGGITREYAQSGISAIFTNHQEITLELFKEWA